MPKRQRTSYNGSRKVVDRTSAPSTYSVKNKKAVKVRVPKKVKVSKKLKAKIMNVIDKKVLHIKGSITDNYIGSGIWANNRTQNIFNGCNIGPSQGWHFTVPMFFDAACVLFSNRVASSTGSVKYNLQTAPNQSFPFKNLVMDIKDSWSSYLFKNNSQHCVTIILCIAVPKQRGGGLEWNANSQTSQTDAGLVADPEAFRPLTAQWQAALDDDVIKGYLLPGFSPTGGALDAPPVIRAPSVNDLFRSPSSSKALKNFYSIEEIKLTIQPGQEVVHRIQGPKGITLDFAKMYKNNVFMSFQKFSRNVAAIVYNTPNAIANVSPAGILSGAVSGRFADQIDTQNAGFLIHVERKDHFSIRMPEQTGFVLPDVYPGAKTQNLLNRVSKTQYNIIDQPAAALDNARNLVDLSVMNPQQPVAAGPGTGT